MAAAPLQLVATKARRGSLGTARDEGRGRWGSVESRLREEEREVGIFQILVEMPTYMYILLLQDQRKQNKGLNFDSA